MSFNTLLTYLLQLHSISITYSDYPDYTSILEDFSVIVVLILGFIGPEPVVIYND